MTTSSRPEFQAHNQQMEERPVVGRAPAPVPPMQNLNRQPMLVARPAEEEVMGGQANEVPPVGDSSGCHIPFGLADDES